MIRACSEKRGRLNRRIRKDVTNSGIAIVPGSDAGGVTGHHKPSPTRKLGNNSRIRDGSRVRNIRRYGTPFPSLRVGFEFGSLCSRHSLARRVRIKRTLPHGRGSVRHARSRLGLSFDIRSSPFAIFWIPAGRCGTFIIRTRISASAL